MSESVLMAIAALFTTSCLVRIVPVFVSLQLRPHIERYIGRLLPAAVFINFAIYIIHSEGVREPVAALVSLAVVGSVAFLNLLGLIGTSILGTIIYFVLVRSLA
jgi:branched-subunit amino acid transport protein AzlD